MTLHLQTNDQKGLIQTHERKAHMAAPFPLVLFEALFPLIIWRRNASGEHETNKKEVREGRKQNEREFFQTHFCFLSSLVPS